MTDDDACDAKQDKLNPFCETFDAAHALQSSPEAILAALPTARDRIVFRRALPLNNIAACSSLETAPFRVLKAAPVRNPDLKANPSEQRLQERNKRPRSELVQPASSVPKYGVLAQMHRRIAEKNGPFSLLERAVRHRYRVRVVVRETHAIRGDVAGVVVAFDKHFNLVLMHAVIRDKGQPPRNSKNLFLRGENVVLVALE